MPSSGSVHWITSINCLDKKSRIPIGFAMRSFRSLSMSITETGAGLFHAAAMVTPVLEIPRNIV